MMNCMPWQRSYICVDGKHLIGAVALVESDMDSHPELSPWLASVYEKSGIL
jgi:hypothetical protein